MEKVRQRELRFRAWVAESERMVYDPYHFELYHYSDENRVNQQTYRIYETWRDLEDGTALNCELMQSTGLKDKNGKEIYEGDVITFCFSHDQNDERKKFQVEWFKHAWRLDRLLLLTEIHSIEVIGNIWENPDLLK